MRRCCYLMIVYLLLLPGGLGAAEWMAPANKASVVDGLSSRLALVRELLTDVDSARRQTVDVELSGLVVSPRLNMGVVVEKGEVLLQLDDREAVAKKRQAQAEVKKIKAQLSYQKKQLERSERNFNRGVIAKVEIEKLQSEVSQLEADLDYAQARLMITQITLAKHAIYAPFNGVLQQATPHVGERMEVGDTAAIILNDQALTVNLELAPSEALALKSGAMQIAPLTFPDKVLAVSAIAPAADDDSGMVSVELLLETSLEVIPGQALYLGLYNNTTNRRSAFNVKTLVDAKTDLTE